MLSKLVVIFATVPKIMLSTLVVIYATVPVFLGGKGLDTKHGVTNRPRIEASFCHVIYNYQSIL